MTLNRRFIAFKAFDYVQSHENKNKPSNCRKEKQLKKKERKKKDVRVQNLVLGKVWKTQLVRQAATGLKPTTVDPDTFVLVSIENRMFILAKLKEQVKQLHTAATAVSETRDQPGHPVVPWSAGPAARRSAAGEGVWRLGAKSVKRH